MAYNKNTGLYEGFIYLITNKINNKQYIGQTNRTVKFRFQQHQYRSTKAKYTQPLYNAFKKYGVENFIVEEVEKITANTKDDLSKKLNVVETDYIEKYNTKVPIGYNVLVEGGVNPTYLTSIKIYQFDENKNLVHVFNSKSEASKFCDITWFPNKVVDYNRKYKGYYWSSKNKFPEKEYVFREEGYVEYCKNHRVNRNIDNLLKIYKYNANKELIDVIYIKDLIADATTISQAYAYRKLSKNLVFKAKGFLWSKLDDISCIELNKEAS